MFVAQSLQPLLPAVHFVVCLHALRCTVTVWLAVGADQMKPVPIEAAIAALITVKYPSQKMATPDQKALIVLRSRSKDKLKEVTIEQT